MFLDEGHPAVVFRPCDRQRVTDLSLTETTFGPGSATTYTYSGDSWRVVDPLGEHSVAQIRLLETPADWELRGDLLKSFRTDRTYSVRTDTTQPASGQAAGIAFTLADLDKLGQEQVWARPSAFAPPKAMTRDEFHRNAARSC